MAKTCNITGRFLAMAIIAVLAVTVNAWAAGRYDYLKNYINQYPDDQFFNLPEIQRPLKKLLGGEVKHFRQNMGVVVPMDFIQGNLVATGCQAHNCNYENAVLTINTANGKIAVGILSNCQDITIYSQETDNAFYLPGRVKKWISDCGKGCRKKIPITVKYIP
jgi:hypothetical protein